ncbi:MAG TPA: hypothetical protein VMM93_13125 [Vicinamibacterales bacterium]|nr:hypothetical protein [Vicinamibacterales bacterium]
MSRLLAALALAMLVIAAGRPPAAQFAPQSLAPLFAAYASGDFAVVARELTSAVDFNHIREKELERTIAEWKEDRRPVQAAFLLDLALTAHNRRWDTWLDVICMGREFLTSRPLDAVSPDDDAFEIAWHKTSIALLEGQRRPDFLLGQGLEPLAERMTAAAAIGAERLVDPWIEVAWGRLYEQRALVGTTLPPPRNCYSQSRRRPALPSGGTSMKNEGPRALSHYDEAARFPSTRSEALVRKAWVLVQMGRPDDAIAALGAIDQPFGDDALRYWSQLFRGRALAALARPDEAVAAYDTALVVAPGAQAPHVGAIAVELSRNGRDEAYRRAALVRRPRDPLATDPWWVYWSGDFRLFEERMMTLRRLVQ